MGGRSPVIDIGPILQIGPSTPCRWPTGQPQRPAFLQREEQAQRHQAGQSWEPVPLQTKATDDCCSSEHLDEIAMCHWPTTIQPPEYAVEIDVLLNRETVFKTKT